MSLSDRISTQSRTLIAIEALVLVAVVGLLDDWTGWDVSLFVFYAVPILLVAWYCDRSWAIGCAMVCGIVWFFANRDTQNYSSPQAFLLAAVNRVAYFSFVAFGGTAMRKQREEMRARMEALIRTRELEREIVRVSEREQMRIGQDLHDGLCQNLVAIDCATECMRADLEARNVPEADSASVIQQLLKEAVVEARNIARGIFPVQMDAEGLPAAMQELVELTNSLRQVSARLYVRGEVSIDDPQIAMHLYRIAQQALNNALQHSGASEVVISLCREDERLSMTITDDGRGFEHREFSKHGMGLKTMHYRARQIGAELDVEASPGGGTRIRCTLPLPDAAYT